MISLSSYRIENLIDASLLLALFGFICYYFGKLISDAQPQKEERTATYIRGFFFIVLYLIFPITIIYTFYSGNYSRIYWWTIVFLIIQFLLLEYLHYKWTYVNIQKLNLRELTQKEIDKRIRNIVGNLKNKLETKKIIKIPLGEEEIIFGEKVIEKVFFSHLNKYVSFIISITTILISFIIVKENMGAVYTFFSIVSSTLILSFIATLSVAKIPPDIEIVLDNNKSIKGKLQKITEDYITIFSDNYCYHINKDKIKMLKGELYDPKRLFKSELPPTLLAHKLKNHEELGFEKDGKNEIIPRHKKRNRNG